MRAPKRQRNIVSIARIHRVADELARRFQPRKIVLFGSYARGKPTPDSDVDLLVVTRRRPGPDASLRMRRAVSYNFALDLLVLGEDRLGQRLAQDDFFLQEAIGTGKVLYEETDS